MKLIWNILLSVAIVLTGVAAGTAIPHLFNTLFNIGEGELGDWLWALIGAIVAVLPAWYIWKGTKLIPFVTNLVVRIIMMLAIFLVIPMIAGWNIAGLQATIMSVDAILIVAFGLIGVWLK